MDQPQTPLAEISEDAFIQSLKNPTESDVTGDKKNPPPGGEKKATSDKDKDDDENDILDNPQLLSDIAVEAFDTLHNSIVTAIALETDSAPFAITKQRKDLIKKPLTKLIRSIDFDMHLGWLLLIIVIVAYIPPTMKALAVRKAKDQAKADAELKNKKKVEPVEVKGKVGRPKGT